MKNKLRRAFATISCAIVGITSLGLASACGDPSCEHTWNDGVIKTAATCTTDGGKATYLYEMSRNENGNYSDGA